MSPQATGTNAAAFGNYSLWFGYGFTGGQAMTRLGDAWTDVILATGERRAFRLLAADMDLEDRGWPAIYSAHPDHEGKMLPLYQQAGGPALLSGNSFVTDSYWRLLGSRERGAIERQVVYDDGAVARFDNVRWNEHELSSDMVHVSFTANQTGSLQYFSMVPSR